MTPREKKERDLSGHCKSCYGNNDKAARTGVRRKKRVTTHRERREGEHTITQFLSAHDPDEVESSILPSPLGSMVKWPDRPLRGVLQHKTQEKIRGILPDSEEASDVIDAFCQWCEGGGKLSPVHATAWGRYLRAVSANGNFPAPKLSARDQRNLHAALIEFAASQSGGGNPAKLRASPRR